MLKVKLARECAATHSPDRLQNFECRCNRKYRKSGKQNQPISFDETPLWQAAMRTEHAAKPAHVRSIAARYHVSLAVASVIADAAGLGPREART